MRAIVLGVFILGVVPTLAQTGSEVERRYGKPIPVFSVSEHIWMTPDYSADGQVCRMRLYPRRLGGKTDYLGSELLFPELVQVLNQMVPPHIRGSREGWLWRHQFRRRDGLDHIRIRKREFYFYFFVQAGGRYFEESGSGSVDRTRSRKPSVTQKDTALSR